MCVCVCVCMCVCVCVCDKMVECSESNKMMKMSKKLDKSDTYKGFSSNISFFIQEFHQTIYITIHFVIECQLPESVFLLNKFFFINHKNRYFRFDFE